MLTVPLAYHWTGRDCIEIITPWFYIPTESGASPQSMTEHPPAPEAKPLAEAMWTEARNARRCELIDNEIQETISEEERQELKALTKQMRAYRRHVAPLPIEGARKLHQQLLEKKHLHEEEDNVVS